MRRFYTLLFALTVSSSAVAEEVIIEKGGALFCEKIDDLFSIMNNVLGAKQSGIENTQCTLIQPGMKIIVDERFGSKEATVAIGRTLTGKKGFFALSQTDNQPKRTSEGRDFKAIDPRDVRATPSKWKGRDIEFRSVNVYWVDEDDVRILTGMNVTLFLSKPRGNASDISFLRRNCETTREAANAKCKVNVRFSYSRHEEDKPNGYSARTVLVSDDSEITRPSSR